MVKSPHLQTPASLEITDRTYYSMIICEIENREYAVGTIEQANNAAIATAKECLDLIDADLVIQYSDLPPHAKGIVEFIQKGCCWEDCSVLLKVIPDLDALAEAAIATQGRAPFLAFVDGAEYSLADFSQHREPILQGLGLSPVQGDAVYLYLLN